MPSPAVQEALAYLDAREADRKAALALSEQKAEEAKLIRARQEGFQTAMEILGSGISVRQPTSDPEVEEPVRHAGPPHEVKESLRRRGRRPIRQLIVQELSFSGEALTLNQIAKAIEYNPAGTETALKRMEAAGQVLRGEAGRWSIALEGNAKLPGCAEAAQ